MYAKTRVARDIYISDEATHYLKLWIEWKYRNKQTRNPEDLIFGVFTKSKEPWNFYVDMRKEFARILEAVGFGERKDEEMNEEKSLCTLFADSLKQSSLTKLVRTIANGYRS